jgi:hypothetical protein
MNDATRNALERATKDLLYPSETDAPFEVLIWGAAENSAASVFRLAHRKPSEPCRLVDLGEFLNGLVEEAPFAHLQKTLEATLTGIQVYRFGGSDAVYYIVGTDADGRLVALKTLAVET